MMMLFCNGRGGGGVEDHGEELGKQEAGSNNKCTADALIGPLLWRPLLLQIFYLKLLLPLLHSMAFCAKVKLNTRRR